MAPQLYNFPAVAEDEHRLARLSSFSLAVCIAVLPFVINLAWRAHEAAPAAEIYHGGITDLAFAGVVVAISVFTNTCFADVRLLGWRRARPGTFFCLLVVAINAVFSFVAYLQTLHGHVKPGLIDNLFWTTLLLVGATINFSYVALYSFLSDEFRNAREYLERPPEAQKQTEEAIR